MEGGGRRSVTPAGVAADPGSFRRPQARWRRRQQQQQQKKKLLPRGKQPSAPQPGQRSFPDSALCFTWDGCHSYVFLISKEKKKVNCKPKNQDEQEIPFRLREIMKSRQEMKNLTSNKKRKKEAQVAFQKTLEKEAKGMEPDIAVPKFKQWKGEATGAYIQRMEQEAQHVLFLSKNQATRQPEAQAAPKKKSEGKKAFQKRRMDKIRRKKEEKAAERLEQELLQDTVKFGEVVLQPPELTAKPRRSISRDQPGKKSLMLRELLSPCDVSQPLTTSLARQRIVEEERERAIKAYRALKKLKQQRQGVLLT
ncbi:coiled-coil domain-containing protein 137 [Carlito syrichta]|uniref:Coiled-coil domain-containing protein 137 n=1 Tax=Carlito syrichta TaxID=1868482 RepID=A0A1U7SSA1_CARSF|nr:coiled-coil domain-containing protein 137 [Carlito syrichta]